MNDNITFDDLVAELNDNFRGVYKFRYLEEDDYYKGYFELLSQLTVAEKPDFQNWFKRFNELEKLHLTKIFVVECMKEKKVIATITCLIELKFIRNLGSICHVEDFVIDTEHRNKKLGSKMINLSFEFARREGCYKILLDCKDEVLPFYEKMGFKKTSNGMTIYL